MEQKKLYTLTENLFYSRLVFCIFLLGLFLRLWNLSAHTEFLGDQGSAMTTVFDAWQKRQILLVGPQMSTGYFPGPAFYYLIAPFFILSGFHPLSGPLLFAFLGVATSINLYLGVKNLWGYRAGVIAATLYCVFPFFIEWDQRMWNPTAIPFFLSFLFFLETSYKKHSLRRYFFVGIIGSILFQLHPTTIIFSFPITLYAVWKKSWNQIGLTVLGFVLPLLSLIWYEFAHSFANFFSLVTSINISKSPLQIHYLIGLVIPSIVGVSFVIDKILKDTSYILFVYILGIFCLFNAYIWFKIPAFNDIPRLNEIVQYMKNNQFGHAFAFTVYGSRSFSDFHYRWYFLKEKIPVVSLKNGNSKYLFVACENSKCPTQKELQEVASYSSMCDEKFCIGPYPEIRATEYEILSTRTLRYSTLYYYRKRQK